MSREELAKLIGEIDLFRSLPCAQVEELSESCCICRHPAHRVIRAQGSPADMGFLILSGRILVIKEAPQRRPLILNFLTSGDLYGVALPLAGELFPATMKTQIDSSVACIPRPVLEQTFARHPELRLELMRYFYKALEDSYALSRMLAQEKVEVKVAAVLHKLATKGGAESEGALEVTRQEIADFSGASVEKVMGVMHQLEEAGFIASPTRGHVQILRQDKLIDLLG